MQGKARLTSQGRIVIPAACDRGAGARCISKVFRGPQDTIARASLGIGISISEPYDGIIVDDELAS